jgi:LAO/AO transport system kinase
MEAPKVIKGISQPPSVNLSSIRKLRKKRHELNAETIVEGILAGDRVRLGQAITLIESTKPSHQAKAQAIINACLPYTGKSFRLGITGSPGVGKSTFIESYGQYAIEQGHQIAVLAVDPSSQISQGSILGDKTRMFHLSTHPKAFIRPSPAGASLGGVARKTRETIMLCEAAGYDLILIETVGVGQSEIAVHSMVDFFLLLLLPGAGDELQGIKKGIVEMADLIAINKADGKNALRAKHSRRDYSNALHIMPPKSSGWTPKATVCAGLSGMGIDEIYKTQQIYKKQMTESDFFKNNRQNQAQYWLHETIQNQLKELFYKNEAVKNVLKEKEKAIIEGQLSPFKGAEELMALFLG